MWGRPAGDIQVWPEVTPDGNGVSSHGLLGGQPGSAPGELLLGPPMASRAGCLLTRAHPWQTWKKGPGRLGFGNLRKGNLSANLRFPAAEVTWGGAFLPRVFFLFKEDLKSSPHPPRGSNPQARGPAARFPTDRTPLLSALLWLSSPHGRSRRRLACAASVGRGGRPRGLHWFLSLVSSWLRAAVPSGTSAEIGRWPLSLQTPDPRPLLPSEGFSWKASPSGLCPVFLGGVHPLRVTCWPHVARSCAARKSLRMFCL